MQCPNCGRETTELLDGFCPTCAAERLSLIQAPEVMDATECAHCRRQLIGAAWRAGGRTRDDRLEAALREATRIDARLERVSWKLTPRWEDERNALVSLELSGAIREVVVRRTFQTRVRFATTACPDCSREMGGYFEAILQVRGDDGTDLERFLPTVERQVESRIATFRAEGRPNAFVSKVERTRHGTDYYLGSKEVARILTSELAEGHGAAREESTKLVGRKDGRDLVRSTYLVRLPAYSRGDFLLVEGAPCKLLSFDRRSFVALDLRRQERIRRELHRVGPIKVIGRAQDQRDAVIVSRGGRHAQVLDPITYKTLDVPISSVSSDANSVPVFRWEDVLYIIRDPRG